MVKPKRAIVYPKTNDDWRKFVQSWWDSMLIIPKDSNPINDPTGRNFENFKQPEDRKGIWFLAGNIGGTSRRKIKVKKGKALFFPEVNYIGCTDPTFANFKSSTFAQTKVPLKSHEFLQASSLYFGGDRHPEQDARADITASEQTTTVDYKGPIEQRIRKRVALPLWKTNFGNPPVMGLGIGEASCVSDGFWVFTNPLDAVGEIAHITIRTKHSELKDSQGRRHVFNSTVKYEIKIIP